MSVISNFSLWGFAQADLHNLILAQEESMNDIKHIIKDENAYLLSLREFWIFLNGPVLMFSKERTKQFLNFSTDSWILSTSCSLAYLPYFLTLVSDTTLFLFDFGIILLFNNINL